MKKALTVIIILILCATPIAAQEYNIPEAPAGAQQYMPDETDTFVSGVWYIIKTAIIFFILKSTSDHQAFQLSNRRYTLLHPLMDIALL